MSSGVKIVTAEPRGSAAALLLDLGDEAAAAVRDEADQTVGMVAEGGCDGRRACRHRLLDRATGRVEQGGEALRLLDHRGAEGRRAGG
jgi:hypothetical protein